MHLRQQYPEFELMAFSSGMVAAALLHLVAIGKDSANAVPIFQTHRRHPAG